MMSMVVSACVLLGLGWPALRRWAVLFLGPPWLVWAALCLLGLSSLAGMPTAARHFAMPDAESAQRMAPWFGCLLFAVLAGLEAAPPGQRLHRHRAREVEGLAAWLRKQANPLRVALIVTATSTAAVAGGLMLVWLVFYLFADPLSLHWPCVVPLPQAAAQGWPALLLNGGVRLLALLVFYSVVLAPGLNGGPRWVRGTRLPRIAGAWVVVGMLGMAAATQTGGVLAAWAAVVAFAALSACDLTQAGLMLLLFVRALG